MWLFLTKNSKIKSIIRDVTESPELWNKQLRDELIALCQKTRITKKTVFLLRKLIKKYPKIGGDIKMTLEQHLHSHKNLSHLEHTADEVQDRAKAGLVPTLAMWGFSALAATYVSLFGLPTGKDAQYLNLPVAAAQASVNYKSKMESAGWTIYDTASEINSVSNIYFEDRGDTNLLKRALKDSNIKNIFSNEYQVLQDLTDGKSSNDEIQFVLLSDSNMLNLVVDTKLSPNHDGKYVMLKQLTNDEAKLIRSYF
jgi:hypothetical protein